MLNSVQTNPVAWVALVVSAVSVTFTVWKIRRDLRRQNSQDYLAAAQGLLERAFESFEASRDGKWLNLPQPSRLLWLTVARMLKESASTAMEITESSHKVLYQHSSNFWRGKLYDLLAPLEHVSLKYFAENADSIIAVGGNARMPLSENSIRVVLEFVEWPLDRADPLVGVKRYTEAEIERMRAFRYRSVSNYLEAQTVMAGNDEARKKYWRDAWNKAVGA